MFVGLVVFHELGHYLMARRNGIEVEEFGIGFPPRLWSRKLKNGTLLTINGLPLGGFVKLKGEHDDDKEKGTFGAAGTLSKTKVMLAGVVMNLLAALVLFTVVALLGMPKLLDNQFTVASDTKIIKDIINKGVVRVDGVVDNSPAKAVGMAKGDRIVSINTTEVESPESLSEITKNNAGREVSLTIEHGGVRETKQVKLNESSPYLGVSPYSDESGFQVRRSTWSAPIVAVGVTKDFTVATFKGLGTALKGLGSTMAGLVTGNSQARRSGQEQASGQVSGPVGIFSVLYEISKQGFGLVLFIVGLISLTLAIMNVLPIPALDGGRLFLMLGFRAFKKPLLPKTEDRIHGTGFALLMLLFLVITVVDVRRVF